MYLDKRDGEARQSAYNSRLVFYLKGRVSNESQKVMLPLQFRKEDTMMIIRDLLESRGCNVPSRNPPNTTVLQTDLSSRAGQSVSDDQEREQGNWDSDFFVDPNTNEAWDWRRTTGRGDDQTAWTGTEGGATPRNLGQIMATKQGREIVEERKASARELKQLVDNLQELYGFGRFLFRCGWSQSNLCMALSTLLDACAAHSSTFHVQRFEGLDVVFMLGTPEMSADFQEAEIRLSPSDVPLVWVSTLADVTPELLCQAEGRTHELQQLEVKASAILRGMQLARGLSCSRTR
ncbi:unnamed protein product [Choristocarpus tenellus]